MDRILITDLLARCVVGLRDEERREKQDVTINIALFADLQKAGQSDHIEDTFDYSAIKKRVLAAVEGSHFFLLEALAEMIAQICLEEPKVQKVRVQVEKPSALRFARSVGVRITRKRKRRQTQRAYVAVGSNIEPARNVRDAIFRLASREPVTAVSTVYLALAEDRPEQAPYYNCVVEMQTTTPPEDLKFQVLRRIEDELGRQRGEDKYAPRTIDLDLICYGDLEMKTDSLTLPDPQIADRPFLAIPLSELAADYVLPDIGKSLSEIAAALSPSSLTPLDAYTEALRKDLCQ